MQLTSTAFCSTLASAPGGHMSGYNGKTASQTQVNEKRTKKKAASQRWKKRKLQIQKPSETVQLRRTHVCGNWISPATTTFNCSGISYNCGHIWPKHTNISKKRSVQYFLRSTFGNDTLLAQTMQFENNTMYVRPEYRHYL